MSAPLGNQFWKLRSKHGRDKIFATPELMLEAAYEYFQWCIDNPLIEIDFRNTRTGLKKVELPKMRAFTIEGLTCYIDVNTLYFNRFEEEARKKNDKLSKDFCKVITHVRQIIYRQKFEGAAAGFLNCNIIARDLGLHEKTDIDHTTQGKSIRPMEVTVAKDENVEKLRKFHEYVSQLN